MQRETRVRVPDTSCGGKKDEGERERVPSAMALESDVPKEQSVVTALGFFLAKFSIALTVVYLILLYTENLASPAALLSPSTKDLGVPTAGNSKAPAVLIAPPNSSYIPSNDYFLYMQPTPAIPDSCMAHLLRGAEESYVRNLARRGPLPVGSPVNKAELVSRVLVPVYPCVLEQRVGKGGEGGKYVCRGYMGAADAEAKGPVIVSVGSHGQTSFEEDAHNLMGGTVTSTFDPFMDRDQMEVLNGKPYLKFFDNGILGANALSQWKQASTLGWQKMVTLPQLLNLVGHPHVDIFKIDCEGCEFGVVEDVVLASSSSAPLFGQIAIEVHFALSQPLQLLLLLSSLENLGYRLFHVEGNPFWRYEGFELAFIHESLVKPPPAVEKPLSAQEEAECFELWSKRAGAVFEATWRRKGWMFDRKDIPFTMSWRGQMSVMMVGDAPCAQQERFGPWGPPQSPVGPQNLLGGPAWVCLNVRETCRPIGQVAVVTIGAKGSSSLWNQSTSFEPELAKHIGGTAHIFASLQLAGADSFSAGLAEGSIVVHDPTTMQQSQGTAQQASTPASSTAAVDLQTMLSAVQSQRIFLLRIDCAGCEYELVQEMAQTFSRDTVPFAQIALAVHDWDQNMKLLLQLQALGYRQFHAEEVLDLPSTLELAFVHERCV